MRKDSKHPPTTGDRDDIEFHAEYAEQPDMGRCAAALLILLTAKAGIPYWSASAADASAEHAASVASVAPDRSNPPA